MQFVMSKQLFLSIFHIWILSIYQRISAFIIPNVYLEMLGDRGFTISVTDEPGIQRVFYMLQVDEKCPALMDYITQAVNGSWSSNQRLILQTNDKLQISLLVQYNDFIFEKNETRVILNNRLVITQQSYSQSITYPNEKIKCQKYLQSERSVNRCEPASSIVTSSQGTCQGELLFEQNFNEAKLNRSIWMYDIRQRMYHAEEELVAFDDSPKNSFVKEGNLHIVPVVASEVTKGVFQLGKRCTSVESPQLECSIAKGSFYKIKPPVYSAQLHTRESFSFKYGKIVVRAKLPKGDWLFPYIMLQPISTHVETHYANQLRIAYARGNAHLRSKNEEDISGKRLYGGIVVWQEGRAVQFLKDKMNTNHYGDDFHNYTMIWKRDKLTLMVDGDIYGELFDGLQIFDEKCFIIFGVTVGGFLNFDDDIIMNDVKPYKNREPRAALSFWQQRDTWAPTWINNSAMIIDFVRVYAD